jgi:hypothetical protein
MLGYRYQLIDHKVFLLTYDTISHEFENSHLLSALSSIQGHAHFLLEGAGMAEISNEGKCSRPVGEGNLSVMKTRFGLKEQGAYILCRLRWRERKGKCIGSCCRN